MKKNLLDLKLHPIAGDAADIVDVSLCQVINLTAWKLRLEMGFNVFVVTLQLILCCCN